MKSITFFDTTNSGHHFIYNYNVISYYEENHGKCIYVSKLNNESKEHLGKSGIVYKGIDTIFSNVFLHDLELLIKLIIFLAISRQKKLHLFYLDSILPQILLISPLLFLFTKEVTGTLHWYPNQKYKRLILAFLTKTRLINRIIVHGDYTRDKLIKNFDNLNEKNTFSVTYPYLHNATKGLLNFDSRKFKYKPYILVFGGLRYDKGLDILMKAVNLIDEKKFTLLVVGKEDYFKKDYLIDCINKYNLQDKVYFDINYIPDELVVSYFDICDIVVLPYRKLFSGQSGPLTEGVAQSKVIVGPNIGELGYTIEKYNLGLTFESENIEDLACKLEFCIENIDTIKKRIRQSQREYQQKIQLSNFQKDYYKLLNMPLTKQLEVTNK
ncbi:hypothetical protein CN383_16215 [Priestia megaterium]|uniref:glycosyltransferase family 4 protein n=1 Tax=Priestia megaterium TaxID=1404 RepID=UPI000BF79FE4|nr:glycosyltransferase [Priestia megaterium]PFA99195.1 hypothetical protein CN383_16215 [Priestia megaterium]